MSTYQYAVIALCCMANISDGFDVVSLALVAPVLTDEWGITPQILGALFSAAAVGLTIGAFLIAPLADKIGRRPIMLGAMGTLAVAVLATAFTTTVTQILVLRFITGIGLGTLVVCLNTCIAEFASDKARDRKSTRLNSSHVRISYAVFCLKKKNKSNTALCIVTAMLIL